jgi:hypothetical protein
MVPFTVRRGVHMIGDGTCNAALLLLFAQALGAVMHAGLGVLPHVTVSIGKDVQLIWHKIIVVTVQRDSGAAEVIPVCVARGGPIRSEVRTRAIHPADSSLRRVRSM